MFKTYFVVKRKARNQYAVLSTYQPAETVVTTRTQAEQAALHMAQKTAIGWSRHFPGADIFVTAREGGNRINPGFSFRPVRL